MSDLASERWFRCEHPGGAVAALVVRDGVNQRDARVIHAAPMLRWCIGDTWVHAQQVLVRKRWAWREMTAQHIGSSL